MAVQNPFFGKRDNDAFQTRQPSPVLGGSTAAGASSTVPGTASTASGMASSKPAPSSTTENGGSKLTVGPNIKLKGVEITDCDTLVVEGRVEATMDSRVIRIAENGSYEGTVGIDVAEIHGRFEGELTARQQLIIHATGRVSGKIRYGKILIEEGGEISGDVQSLARAAAKEGLRAVDRPSAESKLLAAVAG